MPKWITAAEFDGTWSSAHRTVFRGKRILERPHEVRQWGTALLVGGLRFGDAERNAIVDMASAAGDAEFVAVDAERKFPDDQFAAIGEWTADFFEALHLSWLGHTEVHMFGHSSSWGVATSNEGFAVVSAPEPLMSTFLARAGGCEYLREKFLEEFSGELSASLAGRAGASWVLALLDMAEWDFR